MLVGIDLGVIYEGLSRGSDGLGLIPVSPNPTKS